MTTPNQPPPLWMAALGLGAFEIGGTGGGTGTEGSYGQNITESLVNGLVYGPLSVDNVTASSGAVEDVVTVMTNLMTTLPISALKYLQPFIPGATDADFADSTSAVNFIAAQFIPKTTVNTFTWLGRFLQDLEILFDVFHITYPAGAPTDVAGQTSWYAAWNDLLELIGLTSGTTPTTAAPTIGTAITAAGTAGANGSSWSTRLTNDLLILLDVFHLTYTSTQWNSAWTDLLSLFGIVNSVTAPTNPTPTIGPAITSAQSSATTANTNAGTAQSTANTGLSWGQRLTNDLTTLLDVFHVTYTLTQWNAAWADLLVLFGIVNSTSTPSNPAPTIGASITSAQASATTATTNAATAQTTANTGVSNAATAQTTANTGVANASTAQTAANTNATRTARKAQNDLIIGDWFHTTYPIGSITDTAATLVGGKRTWWGAWNDNLTLLGILLGITAPTDPASDVGTSIAANTAAATTAGTNASIAIATNQNIIDNIYTASNGGSTTGNPVSSVLGSLTAIPASNIVGAVGATVTYGAKGAGNTGSGISNGGTISESHTTLSTDLGVLVVVDYQYATGSATWANTATYGGVAMTMVGKQIAGSAIAGSLLCKEVWWLKSPPQNSSQTAQVTFVRTSGTSSVSVAMINSYSYFASKLGTVNMSTGGGSTSLSAVASSASDKRVFNSFGVIASSAPTLSAYSQTSRDTRGPTFGQSMVSGDALGAASITFSATCSTATNAWCGCTIELSN